MSKVKNAIKYASPAFSFLLAASVGYVALLANGKSFSAEGAKTNCAATFAVSAAPKPSVTTVDGRFVVSHPAKETVIEASALDACVDNAREMHKLDKKIMNGIAGVLGGSALVMGMMDAWAIRRRNKPAPKAA